MGLIALFSWATVRRVIIKKSYYHGDIESFRQSKSFTTLPLWQFATDDHEGNKTALGRWLQQWDLYRLPHLWHVVTGDIALVGVKPLSKAETNFVQEEWQQKRFEQMAGFTGLWYLQPHPLDDIDSSLVADTYYAVTQSWHLDLKILWQTLPAWWRKSH